MLKVVKPSGYAMYYSLKFLYYNNNPAVKMQYQSALWLCRLLQPVFIGSTLVAFPEFSVEIRLIVETGLVKDLRHGELGRCQHMSCMFQTDMPDEFSRRHIGHRFQFPVELHLTHGKFFFKN